MQFHQLIAQHRNKKNIRIGRGGKRGTYSGRGVKGQKSRAGRKFQPLIRDWIKKYPKLKGYRYSGKNTAGEMVVLNVSFLENNFEDGEIITPKLLIQKGILRNARRSKNIAVKILGSGKLTKKLTISGCRLSAAAKVKVEKASGEILLAPKNKK